MSKRSQNPTLVTITPPTLQPVSLEEAKQHLRVDLSDEDDLIDGLIAAATSHAEGFLNRRLMPQTVELRLDSFPYRGFSLGVDPIRTVDSVKYDDETDTEQTLSTSVYEADLTEFAGWIQPKYDQLWPNTYPKLNAVRIRMGVGFADAPTVPKPIKHAILLHIGHLFENREIVGSASTPVDMGYEALLFPHRIVPV